MDIGTNSVRLLVVRVHPDASLSTITMQKEVVRLGEGGFSGKRLQPEAMDRAVDVCRRFADLARSHGASTITAVATSATRESLSRADLVSRWRREAGLDVRVVSGKEEARLIFLGMINSLHLEDRKALFIDIGGGSTELSVGGEGGYDYLDSLALGAIRLTNSLDGTVDVTQAVSRDDYKAIRRKIRYTASHTMKQIAAHPFDVVYGSSGTIDNLAAVAARLADTPSETENVLTYEALKRVARLLCDCDLDERRRVPGLNPERADIIIAGAAILHTLMKSLGLSEIVAVSDVGVREGLLYDRLERLGHGHLFELSVRRRSVLLLGRSCRFDEEHSRTVADLALQLFDSSKEAGLHDLSDDERELLEYAALLHDIGTFLSYSNHHTHTYYIIRNADLLGFDDSEIALIASIAYFHRKGLPSGKHAPYSTLSEEDRAVVRTCSLLLRMAESLDRTHTGAIESVGLRLPTKKRAVLEIRTTGDIQVELWGIENSRRHLEKGLRRRLSVDVSRAYGPGVSTAAAT
jgi:exopolyphosphatase/guanosine-5'-triphosphate,3'-diphosphate pyrophosphatase